MCIAICKPQGLIIPEEYLTESFEYNPDGAGFMYAEGNELHIEKGFMDYQSFRDAWEPHQDKVAALHFRIRTHGATDEENTHPFRVGSNLGFIHNGIISKVKTEEDPSKSDTYHFNQKFLQQFYKRDSRFIYKDHFKDLIKEYIGWSKLVFLNNKGHYTIVNEQQGSWDEGVWYSNNSYKPVQYARRRKGENACATQQSFLPAEVPKTSSKPRTFSVGTRVMIRADKHNRWKNGTGTIKYFSGGLMVGVERDDTNITEIIHMSYVDFLPDPPFGMNEFIVGDWVTRNDGAMPDKVGEVMGLVGDSVVVKWIDHMGYPTGPEYLISFWKLDTYVSGQTDMEYMQ